MGREHDLTVIWLTGRWGVNLRAELWNVQATFDAQEQSLYELLKLPMVRRCCIDQSGLGRQFAERAAKRFGAYRVEGISFMTSTKEELAYPVRVAFEERTIKVPFTNAIRADLRGVRKEVTSSGHTRFAGERNRYGHCDRFWALALALHAAKTLATGALTSVAGIRYQKSAFVSPWRRFTPRSIGVATPRLLRDVK